MDSGRTAWSQAGSDGDGTGRARVVVGVLYAAVAMLCTITWWRGMVPFPFLGGDGGDIASWAAAWAEPERFRGDMALGGRDRYAIYAVLHIPLLILLKPVFGDYGTAFMALLAPAIFLQAVGTYALGRRLAMDRRSAFALGCTAFGFTWFGPGDYYGFYHEAQPRLLFQAALPYLLILQLRWADRPRRWPLLFALHGLAMYIHPVSAPAAAFASWLALPALVDQRQRRKQTLGWLIVAGAAFLAVAMPFVVNYLAHRDVGNSAAFVETAYGAAFAGVGVYLREAIGDWRIFFVALPFGVAGAGSVWLLAPQHRRLIAFFAIWTIGVLIVSIGVTALDQAMARALNRQPVQIDLVRNVRFLFPILTWLGFWGAFLLVRRACNHAAAAGMVALAIVWLTVFKPGVVPTRATVECLSSGRLLCPPSEWIEDRAALQVLKDRLAEGTVVSVPLEDSRGRAFSLAVRYFSLLPVAFSFQDGSSSLAYSNLEAALVWRESASRLKAALARADGPDKTAAVLAESEKLKAQAVVVAFDVASDQPAAGWRVLGRSGRYTVIVSAAAKELSPIPAAR